MDTEVHTALKALCAYGLKLRPSELSARERKNQERILKELVEEYGLTAIYYAIRDGMVRVWPFSNGNPFDARDLRENILKARAAAGEVMRKGETYHQALPGGET